MIAELVIYIIAVVILCAVPIVLTLLQWVILLMESTE